MERSGGPLPARFPIVNRYLANAEPGRELSLGEAEFESAATNPLAETLAATQSIERLRLQGP